MRGSMTLNLLVLLVPGIFCEHYLKSKMNRDGALKNGTNSSRDNKLLIDILTTLQNYWSGTPSYRETPAFITLNLNTYKYPSKNTWHPGKVRTEAPQATETGPLSSAGSRNNKAAKRIYIQEKSTPNAISRHDMKKFPYNNVVKLSSGCTGTLLTPLHVLTAAHCVHNGVRFRNNMDMLKVEVPDKIGYRIHNVIKINVPAMWIYTQHLPAIGRGSFDYAVIQLTLPVSGRDKFMQLALPTAKVLHSSFNFLGFFPSISNGMWQSECNTENNYIIMNGNVALRSCGSVLDISGTAAITRDVVGGSRIAGVVSNAVTITTDNSKEKETSYQSIMLLTIDKCLDICTMMYPEGERYGICKKVKRRYREYLRIKTNKVMPIFG